MAVCSYLDVCTATTPASPAFRIVVAVVLVLVVVLVLRFLRARLPTTGLSPLARSASLEPCIPDFLPLFLSFFFFSFFFRHRIVRFVIRRVYLSLFLFPRAVRELQPPPWFSSFPHAVDRRSTHFLRIGVPPDFTRLFRVAF